MGPIGLLLAGATVAVHVSEARGVLDDERVDITANLVSAIERSKPVKLDAARDCADFAACAKPITDRTGAEEVVFVRMLGVPTRIRVVATRVATDGRTVSRAQADLTRDNLQWRPALEGLAGILYPSAGPGRPRVDNTPKPEPPKLEPTPPPGPVAVPVPVSVAVGAAPVLVAEPTEPATQWAPWVVAGTSVAVLVAGIALGAVSSGARNDGESPPQKPDDEVARLQSKAHDTGLAANVLFGVAGAGAITSVVLFLVD